MRRKAVSIMLSILVSTAFAQESFPIVYRFSIGPWLLREKGGYADWLGLKYQGKYLREPINVVIVDPFSGSAETAITKVMKACKAAGYEEEYGHSAGYMGEIAGQAFRQIPNDKRMAFSNKDFFQTNNHGRIMGPAFVNGEYVFVAAFSTERPSLWKMDHLYVSFTRARDDFCACMAARTGYRIQGYIELGNTESSDVLTTGDHDGRATVLIATE